MTVDPETTEPSVQRWHEVPSEQFTTDLIQLARVRRSERQARGPAIVAVNGRSGSGKTTLSRELQAAEPTAVILAADDLMWWEPMWQWDHLAVDGIFEPLRRGQDARLVPPKWKERGRTGSIYVPQETDVLIFEGVGSSQLPFTEYIDAAVWVQSDPAVARERGLARDIASGENGDEDAATAFWDEWKESEDAFLEADMPWARADLIVLGASREHIEPGMTRMAAGLRRRA